MIEPVLRGAERGVRAISEVAGWLFPLLMLLIVFDVVGRRVLSLPTVSLQELEWQLHGTLFLLTLGATYLNDGHVRIDIIRERMSERGRRLVEGCGCVLLLMPYMALLVWLGIDFSVDAFMAGERSSAAQGLSDRWIIKAVMPIGFAIVLIAGLIVLVRAIIGESETPRQ